MTHYYIMNIDEAQFWFHTGRTVRDHYQARLIHRVCESARSLGRSRVRIYAPNEELQWARTIAASNGG